MRGEKITLGDFTLIPEKKKIVLFHEGSNLAVCDFIPIFEDEYSIDIVQVIWFKGSKKLRRFIFALHEALEIAEEIKGEGR